MSRPTFDRKQLLALIAEVVDGHLDAEGTLALNGILTAHHEARRIYREQMKVHARLHLEYAEGRAVDFMPSPAARSGKPRRFVVGATIVAAAACLAFLAAGLWPDSRSFATLKHGRAAQWAGSELPTAEGSRLGAGTMRLASGIATIRFDSGATVSLEAPAELDLIDAMRCRVLRGTAVADVPDSAIGFWIETPSARVIDHGTRFSVTFDPVTGGTLTQVFEGRVDVENPTDGKVVALSTGQHNATIGHETGPATDGAQELIQPQPVQPPWRGHDWTRMEAAQDAYIGPLLEQDSEVLLYLKNGETGFNRKAYLEFDLAELDPGHIEEAELSLFFAPTGLGLATHVPDSTFTVYGLLDDDAIWNEDSLTPHNAPASIDGPGVGINLAMVRRLGSFVMAQGVQEGRFGIAGALLTDYLRERAGSTITLIVVRETAEIEKNGLVHGFASHRHPTLPCPVLAIRQKTP